MERPCGGIGGLEAAGLCASGFLAPPWGPVTLTELKAAAKENIPPN